MSSNKTIFVHVYNKGMPNYFDEDYQPGEPKSKNKRPRYSHPWDSKTSTTPHKPQHPVVAPDEGRKTGQE
jgi:hypothetical protein